MFALTTKEPTDVWVPGVMADYQAPLRTILFFGAAAELSAGVVMSDPARPRFFIGQLRGLAGVVQRWRWLEVRAGTGPEGAVLEGRTQASGSVQRPLSFAWSLDAGVTLRIARQLGLVLGASVAWRPLRPEFLSTATTGITLEHWTFEPRAGVSIAFTPSL
jgi:hypothetical protein